MLHKFIPVVTHSLFSLRIVFCCRRVCHRLFIYSSIIDTGMISVICLFVYSKRIYLFVSLFIEREQERESAYEWGRGREGGGESIPSRPHAVSTEPDLGLDLTTVRS